MITPFVLLLATIPPPFDHDEALTALELKLPPTAGLILAPPRIGTVRARLELRADGSSRVVVVSTIDAKRAAKTIRSRLTQLIATLPPSRVDRTLHREYSLGAAEALPIAEWIDAAMAAQSPDLRAWPDIATTPGPCWRVPGTRAFEDALVAGLATLGPPAARGTVPEHDEIPPADVYWVRGERRLLVRYLGPATERDFSRPQKTGFDVCLGADARNQQEGH